MKHSSKKLSQTLVLLCQEKGIEHIVISPGSRNAPLTIGFASNPFFKCFSIVDERAAAFFALGIAQQIRRPVAVVCSSGSAVLNYYPAVAEAYYSNIPLVVLSADRPSELIDIGDGQTIRQENIFEKHIHYSANCHHDEAFQEKNEIEINKALNEAIKQNGPVHINLPFAEPLYEVVDNPIVNPQNIPIEKEDENSIEWESFSEKWNGSKKKMILVGTLFPNSLSPEIIDRLANDKSVLVLTETTSNLHHSKFIPAIDQLITSLDASEFENLRPDILVTFGGMVISKRIKAFLRKFTPKHHWHIDERQALDTYFVLENHVKMKVDNFFDKLFTKIELVQSDYQKNWLEIRDYRVSKHKKYSEEIPYSDFSVFQKIFELLPNNIQLQLSNSATVRYAQLFNLPKDVQVFCNRGTSGIDGSVSTAVGAAYASELPTILVTGDLSLFYDSNGLWNAHIPGTFKIIVVNNSGGGIFRILPGEKDTEIFDTYFETKHHLTAIDLARMYNFDYQSISSENDLEETLKQFYKQEAGPAMLEIMTPNNVNDLVLLEYFKYIK